MRASFSGLPRFGSAVGAAYLAAHLPFLAPSLEDVDSINFALALREFDPALHQPHPPGHPVYIAMGRVSLAAVSALWPSLPPVESAALALAAWSAIGGAVAIVASAWLFAALRGNASPDRASCWAVVLLACAPLFWMSGLRPLSDAVGLGVALAAQALAVAGMTQRRALVAAALVSGIAIGVRVQMAMLVVPLLIVALVAQRRAGIGWLASRPLATAVASCLLWLVPLVAASGGVDGYLAALGSQAGEDFAWAGMLWQERTPARLLGVFHETFVLPWGSTPLAIAVLAAAAVGAAVAVARQRRIVALLAVAFAPYVLFHLLFHETFVLRYALPTLLPIAWLATQGLLAARRAGPILAGSVAAASLVVIVPASMAYGRESSPAFRLIADASTASRAGAPAAVFAHYELWRPLQANAGGLPVVEPPRQFEWLGLVNHWRSGNAGDAWFFADPRRTDLALIDPRSHRVVPYRWSVADRPELAGMRPMAADWYRFEPPGWFAGEGWSLTPEAGGVTAASGTGPGDQPIEAWVRRRSGAAHLVVGGRHLGSPADPAAEFELTIDGLVRDRWTLTPEQLNFLRFVPLPDGVPGDGYAPLTIAARPAGAAGGMVNVAIRQFDLQDADELLVGFGEGWHEEEFDLRSARRWRWTSERSVLQLRGPPGDVRLTLRGESPLRYFDVPPTLRVLAGDRVIGTLQPGDDFEWVIVVPAAEILRADGAIAIETDRVYLPGEAEGTADRRRLGVRLWETRVVPVSP